MYCQIRSRIRNENSGSDRKGPDPDQQHCPLDGTYCRYMAGFLHTNFDGGTMLSAAQPEFGDSIQVRFYTQFFVSTGNPLNMFPKESYIHMEEIYGRGRRIIEMFRKFFLIAASDQVLVSIYLIAASSHWQNKTKKIVTKGSNLREKEMKKKRKHSMRKRLGGRGRGKCHFAAGRRSMVVGAMVHG
jgi:hypothetical protein